MSSNIYCPVCKNSGQDTEFPERDELHHHLETSHRYFKCARCPVVVYVSPESIEQHNNRFHGGDRVVLELGRQVKRPSDVPSPGEVKVVRQEVKGYVDTSRLTEGEHCVPSRYSRDPLKGFFLQTVVECAECTQRPTRKFATYNAWQLHLKSSHKNLKSSTEYKQLHGDPDLVKFKHRCRVCGLVLILNLNVVKRHLQQQHGVSVAHYTEQWRSELLEERRSRPTVPPAHTLEGWWEGCMYSCLLCHEQPEVFTGQMALENHLAASHYITGQRELEDKYLSVFGKLATLLRFHQCFVCKKIMRHEYRSIFQHLTKHGLDVETYATRFKELLTKELESKMMNYVTDRASDAERSVTMESYLEDQRAKDKMSVDPMDCWYDCSEHRCAVCGETFWSNLRFHWHVKRAHGIGGTKEYRKLHGDPERTLRQHKCQVCGNLIKWEASRIRDHLKFHKEPKNKLTLKEYGERFKSSIIDEVVKHKKLSITDNHPTDSKEIADKADDDHHPDDEGYNVDEWKALFSKKVSPQDKVECNLCKKTMNRHSFTRHREKAHKGILNMRDLSRLKRKQAALAKTGVIKSLSELLSWAGGVAVVRGKGETKEQVNIEQEDMESRLNLYRAGLSLDQIERKVELINSGLTISKACATRGKTDDSAMVTGQIVPEGGEFVEIGNQDVEEEYPTYVVDQDTGEILIIEEVTGFESEESSHYFVDSDRTVILGEDSGMRPPPSPNYRDTDLPSLVIGGVDVERISSPVSLHLEEDIWTDVEDDEYLECEDGPLGGQVMQIVLPDGNAGLPEGHVVDQEVRIFQLGQEEERELEEEMLQRDMESGYILEDGKFTTVSLEHDEQSGDIESQDIGCFEDRDGDDHDCFEDGDEQLDSFVMLAEDGTGRLLLDGSGGRIVVGEQVQCEGEEQVVVGEVWDNRRGQLELLDMFNEREKEEEQARVEFIGQGEMETSKHSEVLEDRDEVGTGDPQKNRVEVCGGGGDVAIDHTFQFAGDNNYVQLISQSTDPQSEILNKARSEAVSVGDGKILVASKTRWQQVGGEGEEYSRKFVSKHKVEQGGPGGLGRVSRGTVVCHWTKMPGDRLRVAHSKLILPNSLPHTLGGGEDEARSKEENRTRESVKQVEVPPNSETNISDSLVYSTSGRVMRDMGCQVVSHRVSGLPSDPAEEDQQKARILNFLTGGGLLDRSCPGCGKLMSRQRNLVTHLKVMHDVAVSGREGEEHDTRYIKENVKVECNVCGKFISRKSIRRHLKLSHSESKSRSRSRIKDEVLT